MGIEKQKSVNVKLARVCLTISSYLKAAAKIFVPNMVVDSLSLPGWFVIHTNLVKCSRTKGKFAGMAWDYYPMPDKWRNDMLSLMQKGKGK